MSGKYATWEDCPDGALKDVLRSIVSDSPTSLVLDCLIREVDDLAILIDTLRLVELHTVHTISMRYCNLKSEEAMELLVELVSDAWENEKPKGIITHGPNLSIIEVLYLSESINEKSIGELRGAWLKQGWQHAAPGLGEAASPMCTFRRKLKSYAPTKEQRSVMLPKWVIENEAAGGGKKKGGAKKGKAGKKKK
mmetsp:Transcript_21193/g.25059  ORF Transcript_21193/g.25059 Transcript_21193/m.25059 type:complete len:194 (+) Transcript_21193:110-691(+)